MSIPTSNTKIYNPELHVAQTHTNEFSLTDRVVSPADNVGGWYYAEQFLFGVIFIIDQISAINLTTFATWQTGKKNYLDRQTPIFANLLLNRVEPNKFRDSLDRYTYVYNETLQQLELDLSDPSIYTPDNFAFFPVIMKKWQNPDARFWDYKLRTVDPGTTFNSFQDMFNLMKNYSQSGRQSGYDAGGVPIPIRNINPYGGDYSQMARAFGGKTRYDYEALVETLLTTGIERRYGVKRAIYWPEPGTATALTEQEKEALIWYVNQQRYNYLAFVLNVPDEGENNYAKLLPGNRIIMKHSETRLDNIQLKLATSGYHTGPKPAPEFVNPNFYDLWAFYSIRLPLVITEFNNEIWFSYPGSDGEQVFRIPVGNYYTNDLIDYINENFPIPRLVGINDERDLVNPRDALFFLAASPDFSSEVTFNSPNKQVNPSTFFGQAGWDVGYLFPEDTKTTENFLLFETPSPTSQNMFPYRVHTPLNSEEVRLILKNLNNITIGSFHGPVRNDIEPDNFNACMQELSIAASTETHVLTVPWSRKSDSRLDELYTSREKLFQDLNDNAPLTYDINYEPIGNSNTENAPGNLRYINIRLTGVGHPGAFSEYYKTGTYRDPIQTPSRSVARLVPRNPGNLLFYPPESRVKFDGQFYPLAGREVEIPIVNYLEDAKWLVTYAAPDGTPMSDYLPYTQYESEYSTNPARLSGIPNTEVIIAEPNPAAGNYNSLIAAFGPRLTELGITGKLVVAQPFNASTPLTNAAEIAGNIALVVRGAVSFVTKALNVQAAGGIGMIVVNSNPNAIFTMGPPNPAVTIPSVMISQINGNFIRQNIDANTIVTLRANRLFNLGAVIVPGEWIVGFLREDKTRLIINRPVGPVPVIGYLTHYSSDSGVEGNIQAQPWYEPMGGSSRQTATFNAAQILQYFNSHNVQHFWGDIRNTVGGGSQLTVALAEHMGSDRFYTYDTPNGRLFKLQSFDDTGFNQWTDNNNLQKLGEEQGFIDYKYTKSIRNCDPSTVATVFPENALFRGPAPTIIPGLSTTRNILWITNETTISATQSSYLNFKGTSIPPTVADPVGLQRNRYSGKFGDNVQFIGYGVYDRPFCTAGNYNSYLNWYQKNRESTEQLKIPPMFGIDRREAFSNEFFDGETQNNPVVTSGGESFGELHQPNIQWNMEADIFFQDIGYTKDNGVNVAIYGEPWLVKRYEGITYINALTWRDTIFERVVQMMVDPNVIDNFFVPNSYGNLKAT